MERLAQPGRAALAFWSRLASASRPVPGRHVAMLGAVAVVGLAGVSVGAQVLAPGQSSQAAVLRARQQASARMVPPTRPDGGTWMQGSKAGGPAATSRATDSSFRRIILPDLLIVAPRGLTSRDVARLRKIAGVRNMITFDGAQITAGGRSATAIGVNPATFRSWVPLRTASDQPFWTALGHGEFVAADGAARRLRLRSGATYRLSGGATERARYGSAAQLGLNGVDLLVNQDVSGRLGLVHQVAALISAPGAPMSRLTRAVSAVLGSGVGMESLRHQQLPVASASSGRPPASYLQLFRESAAQYCPGLSWTVLAAIGQIESADGTNVGPSTAGALGPMQFMPATWARWGIDGFGQTGAPDVMNPYDAVPAAARLLCADGAAGGGHALYQAIFDYNHADWYVREVLGLADQYAADYR